MGRMLISVISAPLTNITQLFHGGLLFGDFAESKVILSQIRTKLCDWAVWQARSGCYSQAAFSSNDLGTIHGPY